MNNLKIRFRLLSIALCFLAASGQLSAQRNYLQVSIQQEKLQPGDSLQFTARLIINNNQLPALGSLYLKAVSQNNKVYDYRWPLLKGEAKVSILLGDSIPPGHYTLYFAATLNFFEVRGKVLYPKRIKKLSSLLITDENEWLEEEVAVAKNGDFSYNDKIFANKATLFLKQPKGRNDELDIKIETILDSAFVPVASSTQWITVGDVRTDWAPPAGVVFEKVDSVVQVREKMLAPVTVTARKKSKVDQYFEKYSTGMFRSINERVIDLLDDPSSFSSGNILNYLVNRVAGLQIRNPMGQDIGASWRNQPVVFYLDEMQVEPTVLRSVSITEIAAVKAFPPPFFGNPGGNGGGIAVYTRRGAFAIDKNKHTFHIRGYDPLITLLPLPQYEEGFIELVEKPGQDQ